LKSSFSNYTLRAGGKCHEKISGWNFWMDCTNCFDRMCCGDVWLNLECIATVMADHHTHFRCGTNCPHLRAKVARICLNLRNSGLCVILADYWQIRSINWFGSLCHRVPHLVLVGLPIIPETGLCQNLT